MTIANMIQKKKIATLRNFIEVRQMALNDPKFDLKITRHLALVGEVVVVGSGQFRADLALSPNDISGNPSSSYGRL